MAKGYAKTTVQQKIKLLAGFSAWVERQDVPLSLLGEEDADRFLTELGLRPRRGDAWTIRQLLRYLRDTGGVPVLLPEVDTSAKGKLIDAFGEFLRKERGLLASTLTNYCLPNRSKRLLASCDRRTPAGRRDYAVLMLLARLGLRGGEVSALILDDLDWDCGEIVVHGKGQRLARLPLPADVGAALVDYLRQDRPACSTRRVFNRIKAPRRSFVSPPTICCIVHRALKRAGLTPAFKGAHLLRHSLATDLLRRGASLVEIGQLLRHSQPNTTQIYAKVDIAALRAIALPWPGVIMSALQAALEEYLAARRALGHKLRLSGRLLQRFVVFAESSGATFITTEIALVPGPCSRQRYSPPSGPTGWRWFAGSRTIAAPLTRGPSSRRPTFFLTGIVGHRRLYLSRRRDHPNDQRGKALAVDSRPSPADLCHALRLVRGDGHAL